MAKAAAERLQVPLPPAPCSAAQQPALPDPRLHAEQGQTPLTGELPRKAAELLHLHPVFHAVGVKPGLETR